VQHRDLHWGQILVKNLSIPGPSPLKPLNQNQLKTLSSRLPMDDFAHGVRGTLIDLGLSRMDAGDGAGGERVHWTPFDDEVFMGEG
jgi:serine/threonine-protein kinase haspin